MVWINPYCQVSIVAVPGKASCCCAKKANYPQIVRKPLKTIFFLTNLTDSSPKIAHSLFFNSESRGWNTIKLQCLECRHNLATLRKGGYQAIWDRYLMKGTGCPRYGRTMRMVTGEPAARRTPTNS